MKQLVEDMMHRQPQKRPTIAEAADRFARLRSNLRYWKLRSRLVDKRDVEAVNIIKNFKHSFWTLSQIISRRSPIPRR